MATIGDIFINPQFRRKAEDSVLGDMWGAANIGMNSPMAQQQQPPNDGLPPLPPELMAQRPKMPDWAKVMGVIGDAIRGYQGQNPMFAPMALEQRQRDEDRQYKTALTQYEIDAKRRAQEADHRAEWDKPTDLDKYMQRAGIDRNSDKARSLYDRAARNKADPPVWRQGEDGQWYRVDTPQGGLPPGYDPNEWEVVGGPTPGASGGF